MILLPDHALLFRYRIRKRLAAIQPVIQQAASAGWALGPSVSVNVTGRTSSSRRHFLARECYAWPTGSSPVTNSGGQPRRRERICCGVRVRMRGGRKKYACQAAPISAAFTLTALQPLSLLRPIAMYRFRLHPFLFHCRPAEEANGITVRVIDYRLKNVADAEPLYPLITIRGVKRKMGNYPLRPRKHSHPRRVEFAKRITIVK